MDGRAGPAEVERPMGVEAGQPGWGSDIAAEMLRRLELPYIALNPGASYRGLHDSIVNYLGNRDPQMILCLHEEHAVAIAHGYAKATGKPIAVALHSNVGLMHGLMAIYNAWCDRAPIVILGATGPVDAPDRRPWIDWIHTSRDQGALLRNFVKWDDQPASARATAEAIARAAQIACTAPQGPVYICLDAGMQEGSLAAPVALPELDRFRPAPPSRPAAAAVFEAAAALRAAKSIVILAGRGRRSAAAWQARIALAERVGAKVLTDLRSGSMFPTDHPLHAAPPFNQLSAAGKAVLREADLILALEWVDLGGTLMSAFGEAATAPKVIAASVDLHNHNGWSMDYQQLPPVDIALLSDGDSAVECLNEALASPTPKPYAAVAAKPVAPRAGTGIGIGTLADALHRALGDEPVTFASLARGWPVGSWPFRDPLAYLGKDGGGGLGSGPGLAVGAALALRGSGRHVVAVLGDGDCSMGMGALWTAAHYGLPLLAIVANNRSYYNDELHQQGIARKRNRPVENRWIGQRVDGPPLDFAKLAEGQGWKGYGPVATQAELAPVLARAIADLRRGVPVLVDVNVEVGAERDMSEAMHQRAR